MNRIQFVFFIFCGVIILAAASQTYDAESIRDGEKCECNRRLNKKDIEKKQSDEEKNQSIKLKEKRKPKGCTYKGKLISEGTKSYITPCEFCSCYHGKVACAIIDCARIPSGCKAIPVKGQCCPKIECFGGCEYNGHFIPEGNSTQITPCKFCSCKGGEVACAVLDCARPPFGCKLIQIEGQCCPKYDCSQAGCEYNGNFIPEGGQKYITPCMFCDCREGQTSCAIIDCAPIPTGCKAIPVEGKCCPKVECGCEYNGQLINEGSSTQITPCERCICNGGKVTCSIQDCAAPPQGCRAVRIDGQCCPRYECRDNSLIE